jgi:hypothetical protein
MGIDSEIRSGAVTRYVTKSKDSRLARSAKQACGQIEKSNSYNGLAHAHTSAARNEQQTSLSELLETF